VNSKRSGALNTFTTRAFRQRRSGRFPEFSLDVPRSLSHDASMINFSISLPEIQATLWKNCTISQRWRILFKKFQIRIQGRITSKIFVLCPGKNFIYSFICSNMVRIIKTVTWAGQEGCQQQHWQLPYLARYIVLHFEKHTKIDGSDRHFIQ